MKTNVERGVNIVDIHFGTITPSPRPYFDRKFEKGKNICF